MLLPRKSKTKRRSEINNDGKEKKNKEMAVGDFKEEGCKVVEDHHPPCLMDMHPMVLLLLLHTVQVPTILLFLWTTMEEEEEVVEVEETDQESFMEDTVMHRPMDMRVHHTDAHHTTIMDTTTVLPKDRLFMGVHPWDLLMGHPDLPTVRLMDLLMDHQDLEVLDMPTLTDYRIHTSTVVAFLRITTMPVVMVAEVEVFDTMNTVVHHHRGII